MKIIKTTTPLDSIEYDGDYPVNLDPADVVEIFKTPLVGSYNWDSVSYTHLTLPTMMSV